MPGQYTSELIDSWTTEKHNKVKQKIIIMPQRIEFVSHKINV